MKESGRHIERDGSGYVKLRPERADDMYHAYLLIQEGDQVRATAHRRIVSESATGSKSSERITMKLTIRVDKVVFTAAHTTEPGDEGSASAAPAGEDAGTTLHLSGPVVSESQHVKLGAFHTLDLAVGRDFTLIKPEGGWDSVSMDQIKASTDAAGEADIGAIVCGEGQANVCLITQHTTVVCQRIEVAVPRKRKGGGTALGAEKATARFHAQIYAAVERHFDLDQLKLVIVASPGFVKEGVLASIFAEAARQNNKALLTARPRFKLVHAASHHIHSLTAVLSSPEIAHQLKDAQFAREGLMLDKFQRMMGTDELRAWYGEAHVERAVERGAVGTLLISDSLFKSPDFTRRRRFVKMVEDARANGAEVLIFSSMHESGNELRNLTGIAALLRFPLDIEAIEEEERIEREGKPRPETDDLDAPR